MSQQHQQNQLSNMKPRPLGMPVMRTPMGSRQEQYLRLDSTPAMTLDKAIEYMPPG